MKAWAQVLGLVALLLLAGCMTKTPNCADEQIADTVIELLDEQFALVGADSTNDFIAAMFEKSLGVSGDYQFVQLSNIKTLAYDKENDSYQCSANFFDVPTQLLDEVASRAGRQLSKSQLLILKRAMLSKQSGQVYYSVYRADDGVMVEIWFD